MEAQDTQTGDYPFKDADEELIEAVWQKGVILDLLGYPEEDWRQDNCGRLIKRSEHGNRDHNAGWKIHYIIPLSKGGGDDLHNLRPLQWNNDLTKADQSQC